jgi:hypothetical protein
VRYRTYPPCRKVNPYVPRSLAVFVGPISSTNRSVPVTPLPSTLRTYLHHPPSHFCALLTHNVYVPTFSAFDSLCSLLALVRETMCRVHSVQSYPFNVGFLLSAVVPYSLLMRVVGLPTIPTTGNSGRIPPGSGSLSSSPSDTPLTSSVPPHRGFPYLPHPDVRRYTPSFFLTVILPLYSITHCSHLDRQGF